ncbi:hypothetical protein K443DRAFT_686698 [Laccaria amethystina LaAM-08-1]|uniref:Uncharacterized protein n=1 Tax=Laccaria amethystina LaAM-08-1 TaxID=1095629 RepID=A0A0C9X202_9AGAR|nr:hypothetical protein K443DRAFT_686698 [Laccaria amethystina LaAM-08-1]
MASQAASNALTETLSLASKKLATQKKDVLTHWADEMYEYVKTVPQKLLPDLTKFIKREGEAEKRKTAETQ